MAKHLSQNSRAAGFTTEQQIRNLGSISSKLIARRMPNAYGNTDTGHQMNCTLGRIAKATFGVEHGPEK